ncbi:MAG: hypothetical protein IJX25_02360 [Clostridia bacterium]|nr:hypothetical protein [Clostridia bacterium]MBQ8792407.1 hypothetical protein [Clostridia bacterium]
MNKQLKYKLTNKTLPLFPNIHDEKLEGIKMEGDNLFLSFKLTNRKEYISSLVGFEANNLVITANLMDDADCNVVVSKAVPKKMLKEKSKLGYGKKGNVYAIREFLQLYQGYNLFYSHSAVGSEKVYIVFSGQAKVEVEVIITCKEISYTFSD